ncbi:MAG TPA: bifunctional DedA family/phosphatase PAP2 family protein [Deltaproteobacteria bacterium]|nr:bifunctional DedA family/phosphatase PAP2 family protein [Deltaproteobacteria bacterium]HQI01108.1 bifunctional DedA family/phosphatase PAP2 family protein [Deltaproteobacteria bacterium]
MLDAFLHIISLLGHWGYLLIFLGPFLESSAFLGLIVPGEIVMVLAGFLVSHGYLDLIDCIVVISLGAILGDSTGYAIGKMVGKGYFERHERFLLFKRRHVRRVEAYFARHGGMTVFWGRFVRLLRVLVPFTAGMSGMRFRSFVLYNIAGGALWAVTFTLLGYYFGRSWQLTQKWTGRAGVFILFMVLVIAVFGYLYRKLVECREEIFRWFMGMRSSPAVRRFEQEHPGFITFIRRRLSPSSYLGLHLTVGLILSALFVWIFGGITEDILTNDPLVAVDNWVVGHVLFFRSPLADLVMRGITRLGGTIFIALGTVAMVACLIFRRQLDEAAGFVVAVMGGSMLGTILKYIIHRPRPISETTLTAVSGWSFPSGHAMMSMIFYGMVAYVLVRAFDSWRLRAFFITMAGFMVFVIGMSRIYLQVHYLSDVLAGFTGGLFWLTVCITGLEVYKDKKKALSPDHT